MAKEIRWKGKTEDELKLLDPLQFSKLVTSRARRSLQELTAQQKTLLKKINANDPAIKTHCRDMVIVPAMLGKTIRVHNGKEWIPVSVAVDMLGHYLGEFSYTRKFVEHSAAGIGATRSSKAVSAR